MNSVDRNKNSISKYLIAMILLFFIVLLSYNFIRTYNHYIYVKNKINVISNLVNTNKKETSILKSKYKYYTSSYYIQKVASNDLNLVKNPNTSEIILPSSVTSSYVTHLTKNKTPLKVIRPSLSSWINFLL
ncbi:MAG: hypothetical protein ACYDBX_01645 [Patescibacteria group bacterium]